MTKTLAPILFAGLAGVSAFLIGKGTLGQESAKSPDKLPVSANVDSPKPPVAGPVSGSPNRPEPPAQRPALEDHAPPAAGDETPTPAAPTRRLDPSPAKPARTDATDIGDTRERADWAKAARDFSFEGTKLGISLSEFRRTHPKAHQDETDKKLGTVTLIVLGGNTMGCKYIFIDGKLYEFNIVYDGATLTKMGGLANVVDRLERKIGKRHSDKIRESAGKLEWDFSEVDRHILFVVANTDAVLIVTDSKSENALNEKRKKQAKTGFDD